MTSKKRVVIFIDAQNMYRGARDAFSKPQDSHVVGQFQPMQLGKVLASRMPVGWDSSSERMLHEVRIYSGRPDSSRDSRTYAAHRRQTAAWEKSGAIVTARTLRYPPKWPAAKAEEKGIDVALAIDFVILAVEGGYDIGIIASTDTDLRPALEYVVSKRNVDAEVAAWSGSARSQLSLPGSHLWCHRLDEADYKTCADWRDYNIGK